MKYICSSDCVIRLHYISEWGILSHMSVSIGGGGTTIDTVGQLWGVN